MLLSGAVFVFAIGLGLLKKTEASCLWGNSQVDWTYDIEYLVQKEKNGSNISFDFSIKLSWYLLNSTGFGLLVKSEDVDPMPSLFKDFQPNFPPNFQSKSLLIKCVKAPEETMSTKTNSTSQLCTIPCEELGGDIQEDLCCLLDDGFNVPTNNQIRVNASFGQVYRFYIVQYFANEIHSTELKSEPKFCREELTSNHNVSFEEADYFCRSQKSAVNVFASGPPSQFEEYGSPKFDLSKNRGEISFRWKRPLDIFDRAKWDGFDVSIEYVIPIFSDSVDVKKIDPRNSTEFYYAHVSNVMLDTQLLIKITPRLSCNGDLCNDYGKQFIHTFNISEIDACDPKYQYCAPLANCVDQPPSSPISAWCNCSKDDHYGNGLNEQYFNGTGCYRSLFCMDNPCDSAASCWDDDDDSNSSSCVCPYFHYGDGLQNGSGCTSVALPLGIGIGCAIFIVLAITFMLKFRVVTAKKLREIELPFSKYIDDGDNYHGSSEKELVRGLIGSDWEIKQKDINLQEVIGRGSFGIVHKARLTQDLESKIVAVKCAPETLDGNSRSTFLAEIAMMSTVGDHPNIVRMIGFSSVGQTLNVVFEYMKYGDLLHFLWDARKEEKRLLDAVYDLTELSVCKIAKQCASGLKHLRKMKIIHGDVAARNVLVAENLLCKLSDFGLSADVYCFGKICHAKERKFPAKWVSPERMMDGKQPITWRSDVWSFGVLLYEITTLGSSPYPDVQIDQLYNFLHEGRRMARPETCSNELYDIMLQCWKWNPSKRPSFESVIQNIDEISISPRGHAIYRQDDKEVV